MITSQTVLPVRFPLPQISDSCFRDYYLFLFLSAEHVELHQWIQILKFNSMFICSTRYSGGLYLQLFFEQNLLKWKPRIWRNVFNSCDWYKVLVMLRGLFLIGLNVLNNTTQVQVWTKAPDSVTNGHWYFD